MTLKSLFHYLFRTKFYYSTSSWVYCRNIFPSDNIIVGQAYTEAQILHKLKKYGLMEYYSLFSNCQIPNFDLKAVKACPGVIQLIPNQTSEICLLAIDGMIKIEVRDQYIKSPLGRALNPAEQSLDQVIPFIKIVPTNNIRQIIIDLINKQKMLDELEDTNNLQLILKSMRGWLKGISYTIDRVGLEDAISLRFPMNSILSPKLPLLKRLDRAINNFDAAMPHLFLFIAIAGTAFIIFILLKFNGFIS